MNLNELKEIIEKEGGKIVIVEHDKPILVIMGFDEWKGRKKADKQEYIAPAQNPRQDVPTSGGGGELTIDDLPL